MIPNRVFNPNHSDRGLRWIENFFGLAQNRTEKRGMSSNPKSVSDPIQIKVHNLDRYTFSENQFDSIRMIPNRVFSPNHSDRELRWIENFFGLAQNRTEKRGMSSNPKSVSDPIQIKFRNLDRYTFSVNQFDSIRMIPNRVFSPNHSDRGLRGIEKFVPVGILRLIFSRLALYEIKNFLLN